MWNAPYWLDPVNGSHDLRETTVKLTLQGKDGCSNTDLNARYRLFLDLDGNGIFETVVDSKSPPAPGYVNYNNVATPNYAGGTPQEFDQRPVPPEQKYRFGLYKAISNGQLSATVGWNTEQNPTGWVQPKLPPGLHQIKWEMEDHCGNTIYCESLLSVKAADPPPQSPYILRGQVFWDKDKDCSADADETPSPFWTQIGLYEHDDLGGSSFVRSTAIAADGAYEFKLSKKGTYSVRLVSQVNPWSTPCNAPAIVQLNALTDSVVLNVPVQTQAECVFLRTDLGTTSLQPCAENQYTLYYCNEGSAAATDVYVRVRLDRFLSLVQSSIPAVDEGNRYWRFDIGDLPAQGAGTVLLTTRLTCDSLFAGQTFCAEAHIYPDTPCVSHMPSFFPDIRNLVVDGRCDSDSVRFTMQNQSLSQVAKWPYQLLRDGSIERTGIINLPPNQSSGLSVPADGSTWRLQFSSKSIPHLPPSFSDPSAVVEACGRDSTGGISTGFVSQFAEGDLQHEHSVHCQQVKGAYLSNSKQGYPLGYGPNHLIEQGQPLDYIIRFQNIGTDTVRRVVILDTLPLWLDASTVAPGASSHAYRFDLINYSILRFTFDSTALPGWAANEAASQGYVKFRAWQLTGLEQPLGAPLGTVFRNRATILFGAEPPLTTALTHHQVGKNFVSVSTFEAPDATGTRLLLRLSPNPAASESVLYIQPLPPAEAVFDLYDGLGRWCLRRPVRTGQVVLDAPSLHAGLYFFQVRMAGQVWGSGRLMLVQ